MTLRANAIFLGLIIPISYPGQHTRPQRQSTNHPYAHRTQMPCRSIPEPKGKTLVPKCDVLLDTIVETMPVLNVQICQVILRPR